MEEINRNHQKEVEGNRKSEGRCYSNIVVITRKDIRIALFIKIAIMG
jgi:hypothetical protein